MLICSDAQGLPKFPLSLSLACTTKVLMKLAASSPSAISFLTAAGSAISRLACTDATVDLNLGHNHISDQLLALQYNYYNTIQLHAALKVNCDTECDNAESSPQILCAVPAKSFSA